MPSPFGAPPSMPMGASPMGDDEAFEGEEEPQSGSGGSEEALRSFHLIDQALNTLFPLLQPDAAREIADIKERIKALVMQSVRGPGSPGEVGPSGPADYGRPY